jgi:hypothetical protein
VDELDEYRQALLAELEEVVNELFQIVRRLPDHAWHTPQGSGGRTPHYTLSRLYQLDDLLFDGPLRSMAAGNLPRLPLLDADTWMADHYEPGEPPGKIVEQLTRLRLQEVAWLRAVPPESWNHTARHPWWGVRTLQWWVELQLEVSRKHLAELSAFVAA